mmetsp:Transcript_110036/g.173868  ORF Transcript_110036/g.173868 Transcript_110036/m.173868 type:complete len:180 (-) Transcript_110036:198-737(-)
MLWMQLGTSVHMWPQKMWERAVAAVRTFPVRIEGWAAIVIIFSFFSMASYGIASGWVRPKGATTAGRWQGLLVTFISPSFFEELWFRGVLLPPDAHKHAFLQIALGLIVFVVYHLNLFHQKAVFVERRFLCISFMLGCCCSAAFLGSGSLWPAVVCHWVPVWFWLFVLGGAQEHFDTGT